MSRKFLGLSVSLAVVVMSGCGPATVDEAEQNPNGVQAAQGDGVDAEDAAVPHDDAEVASQSQALNNGPCPSAYSKLMTQRPMRIKGKTVGYLVVYYAKSKSSYCAYNMAASSTWGTKMWRGVWSMLKDGRNDRSQDSGMYRYYAGPVYAKSNRCFMFQAFTAKANKRGEPYGFASYGNTSGC